ncbi:unnamed protein product [Musa hybrid cultivar]
MLHVDANITYILHIWPPLQLSFGFMISTFISKSSSATTVGFSIFIRSLFPPNLLAKALGLLGNATATSEGKGISWRNRGECTTFEPNCVITIVCLQFIPSRKFAINLLHV